MKTILRLISVPLILLGVAGMLNLAGCKSDGTATDTTGVTATVNTPLTSQKVYEGLGYTTYATECYPSSLSGTVTVSQNFLYLKKSSTASPAGSAIGVDTTADFDFVLESYQGLVCGAQPLVKQTITALADISNDTTGISKDNDIDVTKYLFLHVQDMVIAAGADSVASTFNTGVPNPDVTADTALGSLAVANSTTGWATSGQVGMCGITSWVAGTDISPRLIGEPQSGDTTVDSARDLLYVSEGGLTNCPLPPKGDTTIDISDPLTALVGGSATYGEAYTFMYVTNVIGFDQKDSTSDVSDSSAVETATFFAKTGKIWLTGFSEIGTGVYNTGGAYGPTLAPSFVKTQTADSIGAAEYEFTKLATAD